jgi:hypothetical protein
MDCSKASTPVQIILVPGPPQDTRAGPQRVANSRNIVSVIISLFKAEKSCKFDPKNYHM